MTVLRHTAPVAVDECAEKPGGLLRGLCRVDDIAAAVVDTLARWWAAGWPVAWALVVLGLVAGLVWARRIAADWSAVGEAQWVEVTPPATGLAPDAAAGLARLLAGFLRRGRVGGTAGGARWWGPSPRLALEWWADPSGTRVGVWVPGSVNPDRVAATVRRAWPGARVRVGFPPPMFDHPATVAELLPTGGRWAPLIDPAPRGRTGWAPRRGGGEGSGRAVLDALAWRRPGEQACVQLVITGGRGSAGGALAGLLRAAAPALLGTLAGAIAAAGLFVIDLITPGHGPTPLGNGRSRAAHAGRGSDWGWSESGPGAPPADPVAAGVAVKRATRPHLHVTMRVAVAVAGTGRSDRERGAVARGLVADIAAGYDLIATHSPLRTRWRRWLGGLDQSTRVAGGGFQATLAEVGALWQLPEDAPRYNLPRPAARNLPAAPELARLPHLPGQPPPRASRGDQHSVEQGGTDGTDQRDVPTQPLPLPPAGPLRPDKHNDPETGPGGGPDGGTAQATTGADAARRGRSQTAGGGARTVGRRGAPAYPPGHPGAPTARTRQRGARSRRRPRPDQPTHQRPDQHGPGETHGQHNPGYPGAAGDRRQHGRTGRRIGGRVGPGGDGRAEGPADGQGARR